MNWLERQIAKLDKKIGNLEAWWTQADWNVRLLAVFCVFIALVFVSQAVRSLV